MTSSVALISVMVSCLSAGESTLVFNCDANNEFYSLVVRSGIQAPRHETAAQAIERAAPGSTVLVLAEGYPARTVQLAPELFDQALAKNVTLYIEYPAAVPGLKLGAPRKAGWERAVVTDDSFGDTLPAHRILAPHACAYVPVEDRDGRLALARVAGFDNALFGLPKERFPLLFTVPERKLVIATTSLSNFVTGRYAPVRDWQTIWEHLLAAFDPSLKGVSLAFTPPVRPAFGKNEVLPADVERQTLRRAAEWYFKSRLLIHPDKEKTLHDILRANTEEVPLPPPGEPIGDGSRGILEGYASAVQPDGNQNRRLPIRSDCHAETAMCLALNWAINQDEKSKATATNLLNYVFFDSELCQGVRGDPEHPAYGHVAWGAISPAWRIANYGDDDARVIQGTIIAAACLGSERWNEAVMRALLANLRTTGKLGFRGDRIDIGPLEQHGWKHFHDAETINYAPHYEAALWTCYLWAYARTGHAEFLDKARNAMRMTMDAYPDKWLWRNDVERARMVLALAWLVRVEDTPQHRAWLKRVTQDLIEHQDACGAIPARVGVTGSGHFLPPTTNEEYGTREVPLIQQNGDTISDQLYTTGFSLLALHEAAAATGDAFYKQAEDKLAAYLCRIQIRSDKFDYLDGGWFRAFDYGRWDYWASSGDVGWGAWCIEAGWGQAWTTAALGLRIRNTSMWELTGNLDIARHMKPVQEMMARNAGGPWKK